MIVSDKLIVEDLDGQQHIINVDNASFTWTWELNQILQIDFTAYYDGSVAYTSLFNERPIYFRGQKYIIKSSNPVFSGYTNSKQITAIHVGMLTDCFRNDDVVENAASYSIDSLMHHYFDNNFAGYSFEIQGSFETVKLDSLDAGSGKDCLDLVVTNWPNAIIYPDNYKICIYDQDNFEKQTNNAWRMGNNVSEFNLSIDTTTLVNMIKCYGKPKTDDDIAKMTKEINNKRDADVKNITSSYETKKSILSANHKKEMSDLTAKHSYDIKHAKTKEEKNDIDKQYELDRQNLIDKFASDSKTLTADKNSKSKVVRDNANSTIKRQTASIKSNPTYYATAIYRDENSIKKWGIHQGESINLDSATSEEELLDYAKKTSGAQADPTISITIIYFGKRKPQPGEIWMLDIKDYYDEPQKSVISAITEYPYDVNQAPQITLNSAPTSFMDYGLMVQQSAKKALSIAKQAEKNSLSDVGENSIFLQEEGDSDY